MKFPVSKLTIIVASLALLTVAEPRAFFGQTTSNTATRAKGNPAPSSVGTGTGVMVGGVTSFAFSSVRTIAGEPFSAEEESERSQVLADGTHVSQTTQVHLYRDSDGRTRSETLPAQPKGTGSPVFFAHISDPVAKVHYTLDMQRQIAHVISVAGENRARTEPTQAETTGQSPPARVERPLRSATSQLGTDPASEPVRRSVSHVSLGTQTFEGIEARGTQTTMTIPEGAEGNDRPIEIVCENWESPELKLMMLTKCTDPLHGDHTTRVVSIDRSEPDASLFQVPPDFKIENQQTRSTPEPTTSEH
jgi:hypothetical protein